MIFAHPAALWFLPAAALPVIFHLFFRLRRQVTEFPSLMFFLRIDPRLSAKRKVHEWLILLLRCLFIALVVLALARPLSHVAGGSGHIARLILIDNSGSMAENAHPGLTKLTLAQRAAQKLIASSSSGDPVAIQPMIPEAGFPRGFDIDPALLQDAVGKMTPSDGSAPVAKAIRLALATLDSARAPRRELHIITDLQRDNWSTGQLEASPSANVRIIIHRVATPPAATGSASLELKEIPARALPAGRVTPIRAVLQNESAAPAHLRLNSTDDSGKSVSREIDLAPHAGTSAALTFSFNSPGFHWAQVWTEGDVAPSAHRAELGFWCVDPQKVLFVGQSSDFAALPFAIAPGGASLSGIDTAFIPPAQLASNLSIHPLAVVLNWDAWPADSSGLEDYVQRGGTLFVVPSANSGVSVSRPAATWLDVDLGPVREAKTAEPIMLLREGNSLWHDLLNGEGRSHLGTLRTFKYRPIRAGSDWQVLAASGQGSTLLARRDLGAGRIFVSGLAFTPKWSSLPLKPGFVVLVQNAIFGDRSEQLPVRQMLAASDFTFPVSTRSASIRSLAGSALDWQGDIKEFPGFSRAGVYEIRQGDQVNWVATSSNPVEAKPDFLPLAPVPLLHDIPHDVEPMATEDDVLHASLAAGSGASWYRWLILAALLVLLAETWLANERSSELGRRFFSSLFTGVAPRKKPAPVNKSQPVAA